MYSKATLSGGSLSSWALLRRVTRDLLRYKLHVVLIATSISAYTLTGLAAPYILGMIIDKNILGGDLASLPSSVALYLLLMLGQWGSMTVNSYGIQMIGQLYLRNLRDTVFRKLQRLLMRFYTKHRIGDLISATINDTSTLNDVLVSGMLSVIGSMISLVGVVAMMLYLSPVMTAAALVSLPVLVVIAKVFGAKLKEAHRDARKRVAEATMIVEESIAGVETIKAYGREANFLRIFSGISTETSKAYIRIARLMGLFWPSMDAAVMLSTILVLVYGAYMVSAGLMSVGMVVAFIQYVNRFSRPITQFINMYDSLQAAIAAAERIYAIVDSPEVEDEGRIELPRARGEVEFRNVTFGYDPKRPVLKDVSIHIAPGETVAIVGHTGAGKTTLVNLLMRFYEPDQGQILIDGVDIREIRLSCLRRIISYVPQETYLFPGTVLDNIRLGKPDASDEEVINVCRKLGIDEFIRRLPKGYETDAGEMGKKLSLGEKQLIAIARAMLRNPSIVVLDEALSSVDPGTEAIVRRAIKRLLKSKTGIIIAHRLTTAKEADRIIVMAEGRILEEGTHEELLRKRGAYYRLHTSNVFAKHIN